MQLTGLKQDPRAGRRLGGLHLWLSIVWMSSTPCFWRKWEPRAFPQHKWILFITKCPTQNKQTVFCASDECKLSSGGKSNSSTGHHRQRVRLIRWPEVSSQQFPLPNQSQLIFGHLKSVGDGFFGVILINSARNLASNVCHFGQL